MTETLATSNHAELLEKVRNFIVEGHVAESAKVPERKLCALFDVSRTPLREVLKVLAAEGVVELVPNRGARVRALDPARLANLFELIAGLEALAGRLAAKRMSDTQIAGVAALHLAMYDAYLRRDLATYFTANQAIHAAIVNGADNAALSETYASLAGRIKRYRFAANLVDQRDRWAQAVREHEAILDLLQRREASALADALFDHIQHKYQALQGND